MIRAAGGSHVVAVCDRQDFVDRGQAGQHLAYTVNLQGRHSVVDCRATHIHPVRSGEKQLATISASFGIGPMRPPNTTASHSVVGIRSTSCLTGISE